MKVAHGALLILLFCSCYCRAQLPVTGKATVTGAYRYFDVEDGLPQMQVMSVTEDTQGFIWVGTKGGLARWDGHSFYSWTSKSPGFALGTVYPSPLTIEGKHYLLIGRKPYVLARRACKRLNVIPDSIKDRVFVDHILPYDEHRLMFPMGYSGSYNAKERKVAVYNTLTKKTEGFFTISGTPTISVDDTTVYSTKYQLRPDGDWVLFLYHKNERLDSIVIPSEYEWLNSGIGNSLYIPLKLFPTGRSAVNTPFNEFTILEATNNKWRLKSRKLKHHLTLKKGLPTWIYKNDTSYYYFDEKRVLHEVRGSIDISFLAVGNVSTYYIDSKNNLWLGTEQGLYCFYNNSFLQYRFNFSPGTEDETWSICRSDSGKYYVSEYHKGIYEYNDNTKIWRRLVMKADAPDFQSLHLLNSGTYSASILWNGDVLLPLHRGFAIKKPDETKVYFPLPVPEVYGVATDVIKHCTYIANYNKAYRLNADYVLDTLPAPEKAGLLTYMCCAIDDKGKVYFGGGKYKAGVSVYDGNNFYPLLPVYQSVNSIAVDGRGNVWLSAWDRLLLYANDTVRRIDIPFDNFIVSVKCYNDKWLIIGGSKEIVLLDLMQFYRKGIIKTYCFSHANGYNGLECAQNSTYIDMDGSVWIPATRGTWRFRPDDLPAEIPLTSPAIDYINIAKKDFYWQLDTNFFNKTLKLPPCYRNLQIGFTAFLSTGNALLYRYRLKGYQEQWSAPTNAGFAPYSSLPPGNYTFEVQYSLDGITWSKPATTPLIQMLPYFTETYAFKLLIILGSLLIVSGLTVYLLRTRYKKKEKLQKQHALLTSLKMQSIRSKAIPHFSGNVYNNIELLIAQNRPDEAGKYIGLISRLQNILLLDADKASRSLKEELQFVKYYLQLEELRFKNKLLYNIEVSDDVDERVLVPNMIIHTFVENAVKHGMMSRGYGHLEVTVSKSHDGILIEVKDNGIGRKAANDNKQFSTGKGLEILSRQLELFNIFNSEDISYVITDVINKDGTSGGTICIAFVPDNYNYTIPEAYET